MALSKQSRNCSSDDTNIRTTTFVSYSIRLKRPLAEAFGKSQWAIEPTSASKPQTLDQPPCDVSVPSRLLGPPNEILASHSLSFKKSTGWIVLADPNVGPGRNDTQLCWLPVEMRGDEFDSHRSLFVIVSELTNQLIIIDFEPMLNMLWQLGVISKSDCR